MNRILANQYLSKYTGHAKSTSSFQENKSQTKMWTSDKKVEAMYFGGLTDLWYASIHMRSLT